MARGPMGVRVAAMGVFIAALAACAGPQTSAQSDNPTEPPGAFAHDNQNMSAMPPVTGAPQPTAGRSPEAIASVAEHFSVGYAEFSPFAFDPAEEWFDRWQTYAAPAFVGQMQLSVNRLWSWTWNDRVKAFDARIEGTSQVRIDGNAAVTRTTVNRLLLGMNDTGDKSREQLITYNVFSDLSRPMASIVGVEQTQPGTPLPPPTSVPGR